MTITGKPSISDVKSVDVRALSVAISNIRQRIEAIESEVGSVSSTVAQSSSTGSTQFNVLKQMIAALQAAVTDLAAEIVPPDDAQLQLAVRSFQPHGPGTPAPTPEEQTNQLAVRAFMPHVPLVAANDVSDASAQLAGRAFNRPPPLPDDLAGDNATRILITQVFGA